MTKSNLFPNLDPKPKASKQQEAEPTVDLHQPFVNAGEGTEIPTASTGPSTFSPFAEALAEAGYDPDADYDDRDEEREVTSYVDDE